MTPQAGFSLTDLVAAPADMTVTQANVMVFQGMGVEVVIVAELAAAVHTARLVAVSGAQSLRGG